MGFSRENITMRLSALIVILIIPVLIFSCEDNQEAQKEAKARFAHLEKELLAARAKLEMTEAKLKSVVAELNQAKQRLDVATKIDTRIFQMKYLRLTDVYKHPKTTELLAKLHGIKSTKGVINIDDQKHTIYIADCIYILYQAQQIIDVLDIAPRPFLIKTAIIKLKDNSSTQRIIADAKTERLATILEWLKRDANVRLLYEPSLLALEDQSATVFIGDKDSSGKESGFHIYALVKPISNTNTITFSVEIRDDSAVPPLVCKKDDMPIELNKVIVFPDTDTEKLNNLLLIEVSEITKK